MNESRTPEGGQSDEGLVASATRVPSGLRRARRLARLMDCAVGVPFTRFRFGLDAVLGLVPGLGDAVGAAISAYIVAVAYRLGVARTTLLEMLWNIVVEAFAGSIPAVGDFFDAAWRSNARNVALLERDIGAPPAGGGASRASALAIGASLVLVVALTAWVSIRLAIWFFGVFAVAG